MTRADIDAEVHDLIEAWAAVAAPVMPLHEFLGLTTDEVIDFKTGKGLPEGYVPPARFVRTGPVREDQSIPDFYRHYNPSKPLAALVLVFIGLGAILLLFGIGSLLAILARWSHG